MGFQGFCTHRSWNSHHPFITHNDNWISNTYKATDDLSTLLFSCPFCKQLSVWSFFTRNSSMAVSSLLLPNGEKIGSWILRHGQGPKLNGIPGTLYPQVVKVPPSIQRTERQLNITHTELWKCFHPSYSPLLLIRWGASQVQFVFCNEPIWLANHSKRSEAMEAPQNRRFYFELLPFGPPIYVKGGQHLPKHMR